MKSQSKTCRTCCGAERGRRAFPVFINLIRATHLPSGADRPLDGAPAKRRLCEAMEKNWFKDSLLPGLQESRAAVDAHLSAIAKEVARALIVRPCVVLCWFA